jgi:hypothetical protein
MAIGATAGCAVTGASAGMYGDVTLLVFKILCIDVLKTFVDCSSAHSSGFAYTKTYFHTLAHTLTHWRTLTHTRTHIFACRELLLHMVRQDSLIEHDIGSLKNCCGVLSLAVADFHYSLPFFSSSKHAD